VVSRSSWGDTKRDGASSAICDIRRLRIKEGVEFPSSDI
jgi:hypothetical protein